MRYALLILALLAAGLLGEFVIGSSLPAQTGDPPAFIDPYHRVTWVHISDPYETVDGVGNPTIGYYHYVIRADRITGIGGPFPWWQQGKADVKMSLYTTEDSYPVCHLPPLGEGNLDWAVAIARVVDANPGGVVELAEWLP